MKMFPWQRTKRQILFHGFLDEMNKHSFYPPPFLGNENSKKLGSEGNQFFKKSSGETKGGREREYKSCRGVMVFFHFNLLTKSYHDN